MKNTAAHKPAVVVTSTAASVLAQLREVYNQDLRFHIYAGGIDCPVLRVHDKHYEGDTLLGCGDAGVTVCPSTYFTAQSVHIDCRAVADPQHGFEMLLHINNRLTTILSGGQIIERILSPAPEVETFDFSEEANAAGYVY